jgi:hypothetical protein
MIHYIHRRWWEAGPLEQGMKKTLRLAVVAVAGLIATRAATPEAGE